MKVGTHHPIAQEFWKSLCRRTPGLDVSRPMPVFGIGDCLRHCRAKNGIAVCK
jgi:hypothetical protein